MLFQQSSRFLPFIPRRVINGVTTSNGSIRLKSSKRNTDHLVGFPTVKEMRSNENPVDPTSGKPSFYKRREPFVPSAWEPITPENRIEAQNRIYSKFAKEGFEVGDDWDCMNLPSPGLLEELKTERDTAVAMGESMDVTEDEEDDFDMVERGIVDQLLAIDRVQKVTRQGKTLKFRALVVAGNTRGAAGYGVGKAENVKVAIDRALRNALNSFVHVDLFDDRTLHHEVKGKFNSSRIFIKPTSHGRGSHTGDLVGAIMYCFGIQDVTAKLHGNKNPFTVVKNVFHALNQHESAEETSLKTGRSLREMNRVSFLQKK